jgi:hypothetical protein
MAVRRLKDLMSEANGMIEIIAAEDAVKALGDDGVLFVDVREKHERDGGYMQTSKDNWPATPLPPAECRKIFIEHWVQSSLFIHSTRLNGINT